MFTRIPVGRMTAMATCAAMPFHAALQSAVPPTFPDLSRSEVVGRISALLPTVSIISDDLNSFTTGFRGQKGSALAVVEPRTLTELYQLIMLFSQLKVGYLVQGANTALKGQSTPRGTPEKPVVIIRTCRLQKYHVLDIEGSDEYKAIVVGPGLSLKKLEIALSALGYDLPHKIGSHALGNTFGGSAATGCGGVRVDNRSGEPSTTMLGNLGAVTIGATGIIYNGFLKDVSSGKQLFDLLDHGEIRAEDVALPALDEMQTFMAKLFTSESYPITNHLHNNPYSGRGYEGTQTFGAMMYLIRKKPSQVASYVALLSDAGMKEIFYNEVVLAKGKPDSLPILCESMNAKLVRTIVDEGVTFLPAAFLALAPTRLSEKYTSLLTYRKKILSLLPTLYLQFESLFGKLLARILTPSVLRKGDFHEMLLMQIANRTSSPENIAEFNARLEAFALKHPHALQILKIAPGSLDERLFLQIRNVAALTTLTIATRDHGTLFAFDDAIMPGEMTRRYCELLSQRLSERFTDIILKTYLYGHDLKQISHNDWVMALKDGRPFTEAEIHEIYHIQHEVMLESGGVPHAEHGFGDHAETDLSDDDLVKLIAHRLLNDPLGLANPGGGFDRAYQKAILNPALVAKAIKFAENSLQRELERGTLLMLSGPASASALKTKLQDKTTDLFAAIARAKNEGILDAAPVGC